MLAQPAHQLVEIDRVVAWPFGNLVLDNGLGSLEVSLDAGPFEMRVGPLRDHIVFRAEGFGKIVALDGLLCRPRRPIDRPKSRWPYDIVLQQYLAIMIGTDNKQIPAWRMIPQRQIVELD
ncbi:MAG: hypothetical protein ACLP0B_09055 [Steroidobacteraceae bacterium]